MSPPDPPSTAGWSWSDLRADGAEGGPVLPQAAPDGAPLRYQPGAVLARTAMSTLRLAEDPVLRRQVVLKQAREGAGAADRQLLREARITAAVAGPGVPPVLDAGTDAEGRAWFAMPVLAGPTLAARLAALGPGHPALLGDLLAAARVVARAHAQGIVHRDLKLENILCTGATDPDGAPTAAGARVCVIDWGIARPESASPGWDALLSSALQTATGQVVGTPAVMSPEQAVGGAVDRRTDVWALGVCLAELQSGAAPFARESPAATLKAVVQAPLPTLAGPLGPVLAGCLARDPADRHPDAGAFADALAGALAAHATTAPAPRVRPWRAPVLALVLLLVASAGWWGGPGAVPAAAPAPEAGALPALSRALVRNRAVEAAREGDAAMAELVAAAALMDGEDPFLRGVLAAEPLRPRLESRVGVADCVGRLLAPDGRSLVCVAPEELRVIDVESARLRWRKPVDLGQVVFAGANLLGWERSTGHTRLLALETGAPVDVGLTWGSGTGDTVSQRSDRVVLLDGHIARLAELGPGATAQVGEPGGVEAAAVAADGRAVLLHRDSVTLIGPDGQPQGAPWPRGVLRHDDSPWAVGLAAAAPLLIEGSLSGRVRIWDLDTGALTHLFLRLGMVRAVALSPTGRWAAAIDEAGGAWLWRRGMPASRLRLPVLADKLAFLDDTRLVLVGQERTIWSLPSDDGGGLRAVEAGISGVDWRGHHWAAALGNGKVMRGDLRTGAVERRDLLEGNVTKDVSLGPDGGVLAASIMPASPSRWLWTPPPAVPFGLACRRTIWLGDALGVCQGHSQGPLLRSRGGERWPQLALSDAGLVDTEPVAGRQAAVTVDRLGTVYRLEAGPVPVLRRVVSAAAPGPVAMDVAGTVYLGRDRGVERWSPGAAAPVLLDAPGVVIDLAVSDDGALLAAGLLEGDVAVWDTATGALVLVLPGHTERVASVVFSPDGRRLLSGSWDQTLRTWDLGVRDRPPAALLAEAEARWATTAAALLAR